MSEKDVKLPTEESLFPTNAFHDKLDKIFSNFVACRRTTGTDGNSNLRNRQGKDVARRSEMAAQQAVKIAIAAAESATAERRIRTVVELVIDAAMIRAIGTAGKVLKRAMVAKSRRQECRFLPVHANRETARRRSACCRANRRPRNAAQAHECRGFHHTSVIATASTGDQSCASDAGLSGRWIVKHAPSPSLLFTATLPPWSSTAILTR